MKLDCDMIIKNLRIGLKEKMREEELKKKKKKDDVEKMIEGCLWFSILCGVLSCILLLIERFLLQINYIK